MPTRVQSLAVLLYLAATGCGASGPDKPKPQACASLKITLDGADFAVHHMLAVGVGDGVQVTAYDKPGVSCTDLTAGGSYPTGDATEIAAYGTVDGSGGVLRVGGSNHMGARVKVLKKPDETGGTALVCVEQPQSFTAGDKPVTIVGLFRADYCGPRK